MQKNFIDFSLWYCSDWYSWRKVLKTHFDSWEKKLIFSYKVYSVLLTQEPVFSLNMIKLFKLEFQKTVNKIEN